METCSFRTLREIVRLTDATRLKAGRDYVVIGRKSALELSYARLSADFSNALAHDPSQKDRAPKSRMRVP